MRLLCISDTTRSLAFSPNIREIYQDTDLILSAGDMPLESYDYISTMLGRDLYYVFGNHDLKHFSREMNTAPFVNPEEEYGKKFYGFLMDGKCVREKSSGLLMVGLGGSMLYNGGESQYSEKEMKRRIMSLYPCLLYNKKRYGRYLDILLTHAPPRGIGDRDDPCHRGFECFLSFMDKFRPRYLIHGHVHLEDGNLPRVITYNETKVVNAYGSILIEDGELGG